MLYIWLIVIVLLAFIEMSTVSLVCVWFILSAVFAMLVSIFVKLVWVQIAVFILLGLVFMPFTKKIVKMITDNNEKDRVGEKKVDNKKISEKNLVKSSDEDKKKNKGKKGSK